MLDIAEPSLTVKARRDEKLNQVWYTLTTQRESMASLLRMSHLPLVGGDGLGWDVGLRLLHKRHEDLAQRTQRVCARKLRALFDFWSECGESTICCVKLRQRRLLEVVHCVMRVLTEIPQRQRLGCPRPACRCRTRGLVPGWTQPGLPGLGRPPCSRFPLPQLSSAALQALKYSQFLLNFKRTVFVFLDSKTSPSQSFEREAREGTGRGERTARR